MISVCMATYNGERYIKQQIDSILCQLEENDELIISDDGSSDRTLEIVEAYNDRRIKVFHHSSDSKLSGHKKATLNFENALSKAAGDYIFLSDQDDVWENNKVFECVRELQSHDFVAHNMSVVDDDNLLVSEKRYSASPLPKNWFSIVVKMNLWGCCMAFKKECLGYLLPFPSGVLAHDYWIAAMCIKNGSCSYSEIPLIKYREHLGSVSYKKYNSIFYKLKYRLDLFIEILRRKNR